MTTRPGFFAAARANPWPGALMRTLAWASASLALALHAPHSASQTVQLTNVPMSTSTVTTVKPNLMYVLDDSGSMAWDWMPDTARNFSGKYGYNTSQCNGVYYNPNITYLPPVNATGGPLNATPTSFTAAYKNGYNTAAGTVNLSTQFTGGSGSGSSGIALPAGPAFYYTYSGNQTTEALRKYSDTNSNFYKECNSTPGSTTVIDGAAVNTRFTLVRLAATPTTTITVSSAGGSGATITYTNTNGNKASYSSIKVGGVEIMSSTSSSAKSDSGVATNVAARINACTTTATGNCGTNGYSATVSNNVLTISGPAGAAGVTPTTSRSSGSTNTAITAFPALTATTVTSITVGGTQLLAANATGNTPSSLATALATQITQNGYSATASGAVVTVTGPVAASNLTPVITVGAGLTLTTLAFPDSTPAKLQNFANWYSYYSHRMLMMKTGSGLAFNNLSDKYRVGFITMNNNVSPGIVEVGTFSGTQRTNWYNKLYAAQPANSTPLREVLSRVGQYYAHKFGAVTKYTATITVSGTAATVVNGVQVGGTEIMGPDTAELTSSSDMAAAIADSINGLQISDYGATASGSVVTVFGPASAVGQSPVVDADPSTGGMSFAVTAFVASTTTNTLNGITPADPMQFSCQQNFTILSTDGYWNGPNTYDLNNAAVGQQDGVGTPRPMNDGSQAVTTYTYTYTRDFYDKVTSTCSSGKKLRTQPQIGSCSTSSSSGGCSPATWASNGSATTASSCTSTSAPSPSTPVLQAGSPVAVIGAVNGPSNTLADVAMYYYKTDLRDGSLGNCTGALGTSVCDNNVFTTATDDNTRQHMTTFTLGLGARGKMVYSPTYLTDTTGDFFAVKMGSTASSTVCTWQTAGTVCNWPTPTSGADTTIDDLWHAAVNGRGAFFSATDPASLSAGLANALVSISSKVGSAAAAATSTLNPVAGNNFAYVASYTTQAWTGNLEARGINTDTGAVTANASWCLESVPADTCAAPDTIGTDTSGDTTAAYCARAGAVTCPGGTMVGTECRTPIATACTGTMPSTVSDTADSRRILTSNNAGTALTAFDSTYVTANPSFFSATTLAGLSQWPPSSDTSADAVYFRTNAPGNSLVNYLRGRWGNEYDRSGVAIKDQFFRNRSAVIGDALESQPAFIGPPVFNYPYPGYAEFKAAQASRGGRVYMGTNDGMMHAFSATNGQEIWAYIPSMVVPNLWRLADKQYAGNHVNYVNGSAVTTDICTANCNNPYNSSTPASNPVWKTILVAGLNGGGRGYYALDITDANSPSLLWEFTNTTGFGKTKDNDLGYSFGVPVVTKKSDGTWVVLVTSGYDNGTDSPVKNATSGAFVANSPPGSGKGYLYVLNAGTGAMISKIDTGAGTAAVPSGLAKIGGVNTEPTGNKVSYIYGGDLLGNLWRFDINSSTTAAVGTGSVLKLASLYSDAGGTSPQPITTTPQIGLVEGKRVVFVTTGKYLESSDLSTTQLQTLYGIKDDDRTTTLVNPRNTLVQQHLVANPDGTATRVSSGSASSVTTPNSVSFTSGDGWFVNLPDSRERANIDAQLVLGTLLVPTIVPSATDCSPGGIGWLNFFNYRTGAAVLPATGTLSGTKFDAPLVGINVLFIDGKPVVEVVTATNPTPTIVPNVPIAQNPATFSGTRVLWRELMP